MKLLYVKNRGQNGRNESITTSIHCIKVTTILRPSLERQYKTMGMTQLPTEINITMEVWNYSRIKDHGGQPSGGDSFNLSLVFNHTYQVTYDRVPYCLYHWSFSRSLANTRMSILLAWFWLCHSKLKRPVKLTTWKGNPFYHPTSSFTFY